MTDPSKEELAAILATVARDAVEAYVQAEKDLKAQRAREWRAANPEAVKRHKAKHAAYNSVYGKVRAAEDETFRAERSRRASDAVRRRVIEEEEFRAKRAEQARTWAAEHPEEMRAHYRRRYEKLMADPERRERERERWRENNRRRAERRREAQKK